MINSHFPRAAMGITALALGAVAAALGFLPALLIGVCLVLSGLCYLLYWRDKSAAQRGARRTPEASLHLLGLLGGWPGALIAQQQFHHKTLKQPFQTVFWVTVILNLAGLGCLLASGTPAWLLTRVGG